ncbi:MAG: hypothetical protein GXP32_06265 [Kiritimatiellaeota bacterium]|nr:hypothetical protein [Kiritimatiellota bacterium]
MKNLKAKPELFREVRGHNVSVVKAVSEFKDFDCLESARERLTSAIIRPRSEMEGRGLRQTYVAIGREWMDEACIKHWKAANKRVIKQERINKALRVGAIALAALFVLINVFVIYHTVRSDIVPAFGETMKRVGEGELSFEDLSRFAMRIAKGIKSEDVLKKMFPPGVSLPPEIVIAWKARIDRIQSADSMKVKEIFVDPGRNGVYHVVCEANLPDDSEIEFRLQCERRGPLYAFIALE